jgi:archaellum component FlaC
MQYLVSEDSSDDYFGLTPTAPKPNMNFDEMSESDLRSTCKDLWNRNKTLAEANGQLTFAMQHNQQQFCKLKEKYDNSKSQLASQALQIEGNKNLSKLVEELREEREKLKKENAELKRVLEQYSSRIQELEDNVQKLHADAKLSVDRISDLETRDLPTTIREAMRMLERWICFEAAGSKTRFQQKFYNLDKIDTKGDPAVRAGLASVLTSLGLTPDHLDILGYLKDAGDLYTHNRPTMAVDEWSKTIVERDDANYSDEAAIRQMELDLLSVLAHFCPYPANADDTWLIEDPVEKLIPKPVLIMAAAAKKVTT